jgi:glycosyltransferase involved in cell wall biosynthesis
MKKKLLFLSNHLAFFVSHRLNIFFEAKKRKYDFLLVTGKQSSKHMESIALKKIKSYDLTYKVLDLKSYKFDLFNDSMSLIKFYTIIKKYKPDIIHTVAPKTNLYGGIISFFFNIKLTVMSFSGMGFLFTNKLSFFNYIKKKIYLIILKIILKNKKLKIIVQNKTDYLFFKKHFMLKKNIVLIKGGSGIDLKSIQKVKNKNVKNVVFSGRLVKNKGIIEFIEAAKILKSKFPKWKFLIYGANDYLSHDKFDLNKYKKEIKEKTIIYMGYKKNIIKILENTTIFCLPSYREGMPKSVLEASAAGIPCVVSDSPGCKESIKHNVTGLTFKNKNYIDLSKKIEKLILNPNLQKKFSRNGKKISKINSSIEKVTKTIFDLYEK